MHPVTLSHLWRSNPGFIVMLKSGRDKRTLPISIGGSEAEALALHLNNVVPPGMQNDLLLKNIFDVLEKRLDYVMIYELDESRFYTCLVLVSKGDQINVDSSPTGGIILALRADVGIYVADKVLDEAGTVIEVEEGSGHCEGNEAKTAELGVMNRNLKYQLDRAVKEERYEDAAKLRDAMENKTNKG